MPCKEFNRVPRGLTTKFGGLTVIRYTNWASLTGRVQSVQPETTDTEHAKNQGKPTTEGNR